MGKDAMNLEVLSTRAGFNAAVRHINKTMSIAGGVAKNNLGDILFEMGDEDLSGHRAGVLLRMLLVDKLGYKAVSGNLSAIATDFSALANEFAKWKGVDLIAAYHHPEMGLLVANPKSAEELSAFGQLKTHELLVIYAGKGANPADDTCTKAAELALKLFEGAKKSPPPAVLKGNFMATAKKPAAKKTTAAKKPAAKAAAKKPAAKKTTAAAKKPAAKKTTAAAKKTTAAKKPAAKKASDPKAKKSSLVEIKRVAKPVVTASAAGAAPSGKVRMTPRYAVIVQNELFHNGNVEAWKRIIASYKAKYPELQVFIYYETERILDINSLFKWGKVKHGSAIEFAVAGNDIKDVAKLQRYLVQGASHQFEAFLKGPVNTVMKLFG